MPRKDEQQEQRLQGLDELFPLDIDEENRERLKMVTRTPSHMVMHFVNLEVLNRAVEFVRNQHQRYREAQYRLANEASLTDRMEELSSKMASSEFINQDEVSEAEYHEILQREQEEGINLMEVFMREWDLRMIAKDGRGRAEMMEIIGAQAQRESEENTIERRFG